MARSTLLSLAFVLSVLALLAAPRPFASPSASAQSAPVRVDDPTQPSAPANTLTVQNLNDSGPGSLRQAIADAQPGDTINFDDSLDEQTIVLSSTLQIDKDMTIDPSVTRIRVSGNDTVRVFDIAGSPQVTMRKLIIIHGNAASGYGGGINVGSGLVTLDRCGLSQNSAAQGGGFYVGPLGTLKIEGCIIGFNSAANFGGAGYNEGLLSISANTLIRFNDAFFGGSAIWNSASGTLSIGSARAITPTTISDNTSSGAFFGTILNRGVLTMTDTVVFSNTVPGGQGGGVQNFGTASIAYSSIVGNRAAFCAGICDYGALTLANSSVLSNSATTAGGIEISGTLLLVNSTLAFNHANNSGSAIHTDTAFSVTIINTTIVSNSAGNGGAAIALAGSGIFAVKNTLLAFNSPDNCDLPLNSLGHNLESANSCFLFASGDLTNTIPLLGPLADNGGPTLSFALLAGSPAIDAGDNAGCPGIDQRGALRPAGVRCDIGAYEFGAILRQYVYLPLLRRAP